MKALVEGLPRGYVINGRMPNGAAFPFWLLARCDVVGVGYWCDSHQEFFANDFNLKEHIKLTPEELHLVAAYCPKHGFEAASKDAPAMKVPPHQPKPPEPVPEPPTLEQQETAA